MRAIAFGLDEGFKESWRSKIEHRVAQASGEIAKGRKPDNFCRHRWGTGQQHTSVVLDPLGRAELEDSLFV